MNPHKNDSHETRIAVLETNVSHINETLLRIENKLTEIDKKIDNDFTLLAGKMDTINSRMWTNFLWTMGIFVSSFGGTIFSILKIFPAGK